MQGRNVIRAILFVLFFSIGSATLSVSILCDDLARYYRNSELLAAAEESLDKLKSLNTDYDAVIAMLQSDPNDPNSVRHLARVTLGPEHRDPNTVYPRATADQLAAARRVLAVYSNNPASAEAKSSMPKWLKRCSESRRKLTLFACGVVLILISLVCFGRRKEVE
ncbi:MAG: hypothetical protein JSW59_19035 [Phycisphaerales bacterium]|nr:MAG: hypothetical protein JSW59_19035 [Phycisphaerales bacterium]